MSQLAQKSSLKEIGPLTKKWRKNHFLDPPSEWISNYHPHIQPTIYIIMFFKEHFWGGEGGS